LGRGEIRDGGKAIYAAMGGLKTQNVPQRKEDGIVRNTEEGKVEAHRESKWELRGRANHGFRKTQQM